MRRRLPPLNALRAFEAAGRHGSFTEAAKELHVTPGAVSRHVQLLEEFLQIQLFERHARGLEMTPEGLEYLPSIRRALDYIETGTSRLTARRGRKGINIRVLPTFAIRWFIPHFPSFQALHPDIRVSITTSIEPADFEKDDVDFGICRMVPNDANLRSELFALEELCLVTSPVLLAKLKSNDLSSFLSKVTWLIADTRPDMWRSWLEGMNLPDAVSSESQHFEQLNMAIQAAVAGLGVTIVPRLFVSDDLRAGYLATLEDPPVVSSQRYYLVYPQAKAQLPTIRALHDWLFSEIKGHKS